MVFRSSLLPYSPLIFGKSYAEGCAQWQQLLDGLALPVIGADYDYADNENSTANLKTQTAFIGSERARNILVMISGTHGIEGFAGTAVQCDLLRLLKSGEILLPDDTALLLINALNPWGYAHHHRQDHQGIDVNRNFVDFDQPLPDNPGYRQLRPLFAIADPQAQLAALREAAAAMGARNYEIAFSGGQYEDSAGPFYGGTGKSHSRQVIEALMARFDLPSRNLAVIDVHTGLGPFGYGEVICDHPLGNPGLDVARHWYGAACTSAEDGSSSSVPKLGLLDYAWHRIMNERSCFITLEFGTLGTESLFNVLLHDRLPIPAGADEAEVAKNRARAMLNHFYPQDPVWREAVIFRARQVFFQALSGIVSP